MGSAGGPRFGFQIRADRPVNVASAVDAAHATVLGGSKLPHSENSGYMGAPSRDSRPGGADGSLSVINCTSGGCAWVIEALTGSRAASFIEEAGAAACSLRTSPITANSSWLGAWP